MIALAVTLSLLAAPDTAIVIRVNQVGYLPAAPKIAVACGLDSSRVTRVTRTFRVRDARGRQPYHPPTIQSSHAFGPCLQTWRLDFTERRKPGQYRTAPSGD